MEFIKKEDEIFVLDENKQTIVQATFPKIKEGVVVINHTFVSPNLRGQGIASLLMLEVYNYLKENNLKAKATCPYAVNWFLKHTDKKDILVEE